MGRHSGVDKGVTLPMLQEALDVGERLFVRFVIRSGKIEDGFSEHAAHSRGLGFARDGILEVIHVCEGSGPAPNNLQRSYASAPNYEVIAVVASLRTYEVHF